MSNRLLAIVLATILCRGICLSQNIYPDNPYEYYNLDTAGSRLVSIMDSIDSVEAMYAHWYGYSGFHPNPYSCNRVRCFDRWIKYTDICEMSAKDLMALTAMDAFWFMLRRRHSSDFDKAGHIIYRKTISLPLVEMRDTTILRWLEEMHDFSVTRGHVRPGGDAENCGHVFVLHFTAGYGSARDRDLVEAALDMYSNDYWIRGKIGDRQDGRTCFAFYHHGWLCMLYVDDWLLPQIDKYIPRTGKRVNIHLYIDENAYVGKNYCEYNRNNYYTEEALFFESADINAHKLKYEGFVDTQGRKKYVPPFYRSLYDYYLRMKKDHYYKELRYNKKNLYNGENIQSWHEMELYGKEFKY